MHPLHELVVRLMLARMAQKRPAAPPAPKRPAPRRPAPHATLGKAPLIGGYFRKAQVPRGWEGLILHLRSKPLSQSRLATQSSKGPQLTDHG